MPMEIAPAPSFIESRLRLGHLGKLLALGLHFFCACSATIDWWLIYLGRCPRLYTVALTARVDCAGVPMDCWAT